MKKYAIFILINLICNQTLAKQAPEAYQKFCRNCHASGIAGAPTNGDQKEWDFRLKKYGIKKLIESVKRGKGAMPPGGMCNNCTDQDIKEAIYYMRKNKKITIQIKDIF